MRSKSRLFSSHAWSEIEHDWYDLQDAYPDSIKRKFSRLAALLEIAESGFLDLRNQRTNYERSVGIRVEAEVRNIAIDPVSLSTFVSVEPTVQELDIKIAALIKDKVIPPAVGRLETWAKVAQLAGLTNLEELRLSLKENYGAVVEFVRRCIPLWGTRPIQGVSAGVSVYQLAMMLISAQGEESIRNALKTIGFAKDFDWIPTQAAIAMEVLSKFRGNNH